MNSVLENGSLGLVPLESDGNTSFLRAARAGHLDKVLEHLKSNIDINTSNANGLNALHLASKDGHLEVVAELLKRGAAVDAATKKGNTALHIASLAGQEEVVKLLVNHGASVNVQSQNGFTPLYMAAQENHDNVVKYLLANGANQTLATEDGFTPLAVAMQQGHDKVVTVLLENDTRGKVRLPALHIAAKKDDVKAAKLLLENDHNPDVTSKSGFTPLHIASHYGNEGIANLLVQKKADVNYAAKHNITPLHVAAKWGKTNMVAMLLEKGANIESKTRDGLTPLHCAARSGHEQVVDMLLERDAPISCKTKNGLAPLHMAAQGDHVDAARILLYHRAPVDEVTVDYLTALHVAAHCGHVRVAKLLLDRQADANARALNGFTPLHIACKKNRIKVVELLLKHGASISATTESGLTPLHVASFMGCMNIVIYLLQHDANPDVPTVRGETPLHLAARANQTDIIRILLRNGSQVDARAREQQTPLHIASRLGNVDIVMLLLQHGAKVDTATKDMYTALHIAAKEGQDEVAAVLIENGASLNSTTKKGFTPLHLASKYGNIKVAKLLLQKEAPVDAQGKNGVTPLHVASHYDHQQVALLLLDKGASPHATAKNGHTPLHIAAKKNQMDIANTLLEYGAKPNAESKAGFTPLHLSAQEGHVDMTSLLIEHEADTNCQAKNGLTPLHLCAQEDRVPVAEVLVKNKATVDKASKAGYTPLHVACHYGQSNMVRFLLNHGADVTSTTTIGYTPLHQAAQQGHTNIVNVLLENSAQPNAITHSGQTPLHIAQKLGYISVIDTLKLVTQATPTTPASDEKYKVVAPEAMHETFMSDSEEEGGEDTMLGDNAYRYLTADEMKSLGDDSLPIDVTRDERIDSNRLVTSGDSNLLPPQAIEDSISPQQYHNNYSEYIKKYTPDNVDIARHPINIGKLHWKNFLVSFLVDARGGAMRGCRHSGVRVIVPPRSAGSPTRITCRYVRPQRTPHPPPLMEGEALASRVLELGPVGAKFLGPVIIEVPHFAALRGKEREIVILRSDNGETWREHTVDSSEDILNDVLSESFEAEDISQLEDVSSGRITRILTHDFPQYFAVVSRIRQEVHAIGPEGGMVSSTVVPQVQAVFPQGALTKKIKVGLQAQPIDPELTAKLLGHGVAVSPVVTVEPRRRKFHKAITLSMPAPRAHSQGMINQYSGSTPTLRLLCSITGGTTRAQWEDVTGSTPLTFVNDCVSFTTTVSARFWLMDCRNIGDATKMATELYREAIHVPFMAKFVVFAKRIDPLEARLRVFCMTDDKEDKTLEHQEHFTEVAKSRDVEVLEGKSQYVEFAGNLIPITKSGEQLQFAFRAFRENRLPFSVKVKDQHAEAIGRSLFMRESKVPKGDPPQQPICILNIVLPDDIVADTISLTDSDSIKRHEFLKDSYEYYRPDPRLADISNLLGEDWVLLATQLGLTTSEINVIKSEYLDSVAKQAQSMLRMWISQSSNRSQSIVLENALRRIGREDIIPQCLNEEPDIIKKEETVKYRIKKDISFEDRDIMKDSESVESLIQNERKEDKIKKRGSYDKYSAEEKVVEEPSDEEDFSKTVREKRELIEKRLSVERTIPASSQRVEIAQEISSIKRQSIVEDKIAEVETQKRLTPPETKTIEENLPVESDIYVTTEKTIVEEITPEKQTTTTTVVTETRTIKETVNITHKTEDERNDDLLENVAQRLETKKVIPNIVTDADPRSPKLSKTPPPSPADFNIKEKAATVQEWEASREDTEEDAVLPLRIKTQENIEIGSVSLTYSTEKTLPQPIPRTSNISNQLELLSPIETQINLETSTSNTKNDSLITEINSYSDRKKFWENVTKDNDSDIQSKRKSSPYEEFVDIQNLVSNITKEHEELMQPPIPKPRLHQTAPTNLEPLIVDEDVSHKSISEYQDSYKDPQNIPSQDEKRQNITESKESIDSDNENSYQFNTSSGYENTGYISDSGDVEQYISDSEIEDRVPQIRERQMSVFQAPTPSIRRSIYERSCSLPTEDLYEVSAQSILLRKQMFEEQIKKDMVDDVLMTEIEEEPSPEHKTLEHPNVAEEEEPTGVKSVPECSVSLSSDLSAIAKLNDKVSLMEKAEALILDEDFDADIISNLEAENYKILETSEIVKVTSDLYQTIDDKCKYEEHLPSDIIRAEDILNISDLKHSDESQEIHVDKSEIEASEKKLEVQFSEDVLENIVEQVSRTYPEEIPEITFSLSGIQKRISEESDGIEEKEIEIPKQSEAGSPINPEITFSLSGIQKRISEESDGDEEKEIEIPKRSEAGSPINHPEEHVQETVWEVSIESQPQTYEEVITDIHVHTHGTIERDDDFSGSVRDESDLGSEIHQDHSESYGSDHRSDSQADIEKLILESLHHQKISPEEAKLIASELVADIEAEIHQRNNYDVKEPPAPEYAKNQVSDYLRQLAEAKGLDSREVELVQSVLARKQREMTKLSRGDTQASSIEITDEDLRYSGTEISPSCSLSNILEEQIDKLEEEKIKKKILNAEELIKIETKDSFPEEVISSKTTLITNRIEELKAERASKEHKDIIFEEEEIFIDTSVKQTEDTQKLTKDETEISTKLFTINKEETSLSKQQDKAESQISLESSQNITSVIAENEVKVKSTAQTEDQNLSKIENISQFEKTSKEVLSDKIVEEKVNETEDLITVEKDFIKTTVENIDTISNENGIETKRSAQTESTKETKTKTFTEDTHKESIVTSTKILTDITSVDVQNILDSKNEKVGLTHIYSDDSKSSEESFKSPDDIMSTSSSKKEDDESKLQKEEVIFRKVRQIRDDSSSTSSNLKPDRKSGIDFETYSSSGESHYQSFEIDSTKSRPCSSEMDLVIAAGSSDYESAVTSQEISAQLHLTTSTEYHTAVSSISSKESMKSLDSESSGNLASVEVSEASETLVPSEFEFCVDSSEHSKINSSANVIHRQNTDLSESEIPFDTHRSMDIEEDFSTNIDVPSKMKRSQEMTFQPEPKSLVPDSPHYDHEDVTEMEDRLGASVEDGSILSMSLSSTSSINAQKTVIELSHTDSEKLDAGMSISNLSEQLSFEDSEYIGSRENLSLTPTLNTTNEMSTSTQMLPQSSNVNNVTLTTTTVNENGVQSAGTQVTQILNTTEFSEQKKRGHRRTDSTTFVPTKFTNITSLTEIEKKIQSDLAESDKYTHPLSLKQSDSFDKKDFSGESYETEADQGLHRDISEGKYAKSDVDESKKSENTDEPGCFSKTENISTVEQFESKSFLYDETNKVIQDITKKVYRDILDKRDSHGKSSSTSSEKSSFEEAEAEAAFNMVAHTSPAHKIKQICPIMEDEDAEKHELETREKAQKDLEKRIALLKDQSPGAIPDIKVTQHMTPLDRKGFHYPDLELEEKEIDVIKSTPETPASNSSKSSESSDQVHEYVLDESETSIPEESESQIQDDKTATDSKSDIISIIDKTIQYETDKETVSPTESPNSDSFEILEKPDIMDEFVVIEEVAKEAQETDMEGKSLKISKGKSSKKHDEEVEQLLVRSAPSPSTKMTEIKYYPDGSSSDELGFEFEDSPPDQKNKGGSSPRDYVYEYDKELEANKKWIEQQFQGDHAAMVAAGYGYEMEFERCPLEDIKEEDGNDFDSSRIGSLNSQKESGGSLGSVKDSYSSTPEYDVLAGRRYFTKSGEHDDISMSSLQEFESLERAMSLETRKFHQGSQDSSSNGSFKTRYFGRSGQGDDISVSSLKEFEGLEKACIAAHKVEVKAKEEEMLLTQIDEGAESIASESESCETITSIDKKTVPESDEEDYEKRMFEIDEIIRQAQTNVERFIDLKDGERTESIGRGDSVEEVSKIPDLELDAPLPGTIKVKWNDSDDIMQVSVDSLDVKEKSSHHGSADSLDQKTGGDIMTASTDSIEFQAQKNRSTIVSDSLDFRDQGYTMTSSDSLEMPTGSNVQAFSDSIDEDGSKLYGYDQSSCSSTGKDLSAKEDEYFVDSNKVLCDLLESTDSIASTSAGTHATYQYETDSVFSGSFTSGGSNTMVSSTDNIDTTLKDSVNIVDAVKKVWFEDEDYLDENKPYVTEIIEPGESEITRYTFKGPDLDQNLKQFIDNFHEGETVREERTVDSDGSIHIRRTIENRVILKDNVEKIVFGDGNSKTTRDHKGETTIYSQDFKSTEDYNTAVQSLLTSKAGECSGETSTSGPRSLTGKKSGPQVEADESNVGTTSRSVITEDKESKQARKLKEEKNKE